MLDLRSLIFWTQRHVTLSPGFLFYLIDIILLVLYLIDIIKASKK